MQRLSAVLLSLLGLSHFLITLGADPDPKVKPPAEVENSIAMKLVRIPAGEFLMGSKEDVDALDKAFPAYKLKTKADLFEDEPQHKVRITRPFYFGKYEVTLGQFTAFIKDSGYKVESERDGTGGWGINATTGKFEGRKPAYSWKNPGYPQKDDHPVVNVTWADAVAYCEWLSKKENKTYRLPTEAEWEYACRAGTKTRYYGGDDPKTLLKTANTADRSAQEVGKKQFKDWEEHVLDGKDGHAHTAPVGSYVPNAFGLHDMHGNVWEWCSDWYGEDYYTKSPVDDPKGPDKGHLRVRRGGAWHTYPLYLRAAFRNYNRPDSRYLNLGFRVVLEATP